MHMHHKYRFFVLLVGLIGCCGLLACSSPGEKRDSFIARGSKLEKAGDYARARLEYKNAIQVDPRCGKCYESLGRVELALNNIKGARAVYMRATELMPERIDLHLVLGRLFVLGKEPVKAEEQARRVLARQPDKPDALALLATALSFQKDKSSEALEMSEKLRKQDPSIADGYVIGARMLVNQGRPEAAVALLREGLDEVKRKPPILYVLLSLHVHMKDWQAAVEVGERLKSLEPDDFMLRRRLAYFYEQSGRKEKAEAVLMEAVGMAPDNPNLVLALSDFFVRNKENAKAETFLRQKLHEYPTKLDLRVAYARILRMRGKEEQALDILNEVPDEDLSGPQSLFIRNEIAGLLFSLGRFDDARTHIESVLKENPKDAAALLLKARLSMAEGEGETAVMAFRRLLSESPDNVGLHVMLARAHLLEKEFRLAEDQLQKVVKLRPDDLATWSELITFYVLEDDPKRAAETLSRAFSTFPDSPVLYRLQGNFYRRQADLKKAEASFRKAIRLAPDWISPYRNLAAVLARSKRPEKVEQNLKRDVEQKPESIPRKILLAGFYEETGNTAAAVTVYEGIVEKNLENPVVLNNLAYLYAETYSDENHLEHALDLINRAEEQVPGSGIILDTKAWIVYKMGDPGAALEILRQAMAVSEGDPTLFYHQGVILRDLGRKAEARASIKKALDNPRPFPEKESAGGLLEELKGGPK